MNLHHLFTLLILSIGTSGTNQIQYMKYTSEYILKLQIHQHLIDSGLEWIYARKFTSQEIQFLAMPSLRWIYDGFNFLFYRSKDDVT